ALVSAPLVAMRNAVVARRGAWSALALAVACIAWTPFAARRLHAADNLRPVLIDHAPLLGRAVLVAARISPQAPADAAEGEGTAAITAAALPGEIPRALDWTGRDVVLLSVDALRADHVGAYGYARATTPGIDRLAAEGTVFA